jgi:hypothetical protein
MKLTLRELFLLVVIAAMGCGWWVSARQFRYREWYQQKTSDLHGEELQQLGYKIERDDEVITVYVPEDLQTGVGERLSSQFDPNKKVGKGRTPR